MLSSEDSMSMLFLVPKKHKMEKFPMPKNENKEFKQQPVKTVTVISFGVQANTKKIENYKTKLISLLNCKGLSRENQFFYFGYNSGCKVFNRKNIKLSQSLETLITNQLKLTFF